ncbi:hypothetical protein PV325_013543 [Microctonus aethiopoides]|uniref:Triadin n=1 Tax=Microctonus aethiopoides TaxID=144406 RepID=A0AA39FIJ5_9HYME|nr:hypothetical protein PV325_013543 [Microctonus aethiopoides]KAK0170242.1 hypothetical protein PV328_010824 [Microctonus aethiopoides]
MDASLLIQHFQYAIPVGIVLVCAVLVFVFGFKNAEQPPFAHLSAVSDVERKQANKKRSKIKEKRATSNQVVSEKASPVKKASPAKAETVKKSASKNDEVDGKLKERKQDENTPAVAKKEKSQISAKAGKENKVEQVKNKKNMKNLILEKPVDFDEGDWEQAYSRKDKKKKKEEETPKKTKKSKKNDLISDVGKNKDQDKNEIKDKVAKETENKELKEKNQKDIILEPVNNNVESESKIANVEPKDEVKKINKVEKVEEKKSVKSKKAKKSNDNENTPVQNPARNEKKSAEKLPEKKAEDVIKKKTETLNETPKVVVESEKSAAAFDELGDVWTEAKTQKKSKKKARKDN